MEKLFSSVSLVGKGSGVTSEVGSPRRDTGGASQSW